MLMVQHATLEDYPADIVYIVVLCFLNDFKILLKPGEKAKFEERQTYLCPGLYTPE